MDYNMATLCIYVIQMWPNNNNDSNIIAIYSYMVTMLTFTVPLVRLKDISSWTFTIITTFSIDTIVGTVTIVIKTLVNICNSNV